MFLTPPPYFDPGLLKNARNRQTNFGVPFFQKIVSFPKIFENLTVFYSYSSFLTANMQLIRYYLCLSGLAPM